MDIIINERSFDGHIAKHEITTLMQQLADLIAVLTPITGGGQVLLHSDFFSRFLTPNLMVSDWFFDQGYRAEDNTFDSWQALLGAFQTAFTAGPRIDELLYEQCDPNSYACECAGTAAEGSGIDAAAQLGGVLVSLRTGSDYPDGPLAIIYSTDDLVETRMVAHFVEINTARKCRRRYVPNKKHHPAVARGDHTPMLLDTVYDPLDRHEAELRDVGIEPWDTQVQRLLDRAYSNGKQLYAQAYDQAGKNYIIYEFQHDNSNPENRCFHGYPVPETEVRSDILRQFKQMRK